MIRARQITFSRKFVSRRGEINYESRDGPTPDSLFILEIRFLVCSTFVINVERRSISTENRKRWIEDEFSRLSFSSSSF